MWTSGSQSASNQQAKAKTTELAEQFKPWSELIDKSERDKMWNTGYSLNSK